VLDTLTQVVLQPKLFLESKTMSRRTSSAAAYHGEQKQQQNSRRRISVVVPQYPCNGGLDTKFQSETREVHDFHLLADEITAADYVDAIESINEELKPSRAGPASVACLATGIALLPLVPFALLTIRRKKLRKRIIHRVIKDFNTKHPRLLMRWRRKPVSQLVIEMADRSAATQEVTMTNV